MYIRTFLEKIFRETVLELTTDKSFDRLLKRIKDHERTVRKENTFLVRTAELEAEVARFRKHVEENRTLLLRAVQTTSENVGKLKDEYEVSYFICATTSFSYAKFVYRK